MSIASYLATDQVSVTVAMTSFTSGTTVIAGSGLPILENVTMASFSFGSLSAAATIIARSGRALVLFQKMQQ